MWGQSQRLEDDIRPWNAAAAAAHAAQHGVDAKHPAVCGQAPCHIKHSLGAHITTHRAAQDGVDVKHSERIAAQQVLPELREALRGELRAEGVDPEAWLKVEDDSVEYDENGEVGAAHDRGAAHSQLTCLWF